MNRQRKGIFLPIICIAVSLLAAGMIDNSQQEAEQQIIKSHIQEELRLQFKNNKDNTIQLLLDEKMSLETKKSKEELIKWVYDNSKVKDYAMARLIVTESLKTKRPFLLLAMFKKESEFYPKAKSRVGAKGLGQIMSMWVPDLKKAGIIRSEKDLFNPACNIRATDYVISLNLQETDGRYKEALDRYLGCEWPPYSNTILKDRSYLKMKHKSLIASN